MPVEVFDKDQFITLSAKAKECRVVKRAGMVKLKLRAKKLFVIKVKEEEAKELTAMLKCPVVEL